MSKKFKGNRFFLFETDINDNNIILGSIINPLFIVKSNGNVCIHTNRDIDYSFDYTKSEVQIQKRLLLVATNSNLDFHRHLINLDNVIKTNTIDKNIYRPIADFIHTIDIDKPIIKYEDFSFGFSFNKFKDNNYMVSIPLFTFYDETNLIQKLDCH
jgi:hypothetical protein